MEVKKLREFFELILSGVENENQLALKLLDTKIQVVFLKLLALEQALLRKAILTRKEIEEGYNEAIEEFKELQKEAEALFYGDEMETIRQRIEELRKVRGYG